MTTELTLTIPDQWWMTSNQRLHWTQRRARTANLRVFTLAEAQRARLPRLLERVQITAHISRPTARSRDVHNVMPTIKPIEIGRASCRERV